ncbi:hypothetical protein ACO0RG_003555 [Hanseniaspora osmophila]
MNCEVCQEEPSKYKCPICQLKYGSLACYKTHQKTHANEATLPEPEKQCEKKTTALKDTKMEDQSEMESSSNQLIHEKLHTSIYQNLLDHNKIIQELLSYNAVKYHLHKVYKILTIPEGASNTVQSTEQKEQMAVDYLNTLRTGGNHYNEAVEEFCQVVLSNL